MTSEVTVRSAILIAIWLFAMSVLWALASEDSAPCAVSKPGANTADRPGNYGTPALSTTLYPEGKVEFIPSGPGFVLPDGSLKMKFPWWKKTEAKLTITGRRLDAAAPPLRAEVGESADPHMVPTYIIFPTTGCWEVTGKAQNSMLTFVTRVVKVGRGP